MVFFGILERGGAIFGIVFYGNRWIGMLNMLGKNPAFSSWGISKHILNLKIKVYYRDQGGENSMWQKKQFVKTPLRDN